MTLQTLATAMSLADMHEMLGRFSADGSGAVYANDKAWNANAPSNLRGLAIDDVVRPCRPMPTDTGDLHAIQAEWDETSRLMDAALVKFRKHGNARLYRIECRAIIEREA